MKALWNKQVIAESGNTVVVEGNHYFPRSALNEEYFEPNSTQTFCPWKGNASYLDVIVDGQRNEAAAWIYLEPKSAAAEIKDHVAFWKGIVIES